MIQDAWTTTIFGRTSEEFIVVKVAKGTARNRALAQRVINALRARIPVEKLKLDVVVIDGESTERPAVIGTAAGAEQAVRDKLPALATHRWQLTKLER
jgi:hypothetical protein